MQNFKLLLREQGFKATHQRLAILTSIARYGHIDIESLFKKLTSEFPSLALGTLYRNIGELKEKRIVTEVKVRGHKDVYEITKAPHIHLVCESCGEIEDLSVPFEPVMHAVEAQSRFKVYDALMTFHGRCESCRGL